MLADARARGFVYSVAIAMDGNGWQLKHVVNIVYNFRSGLSFV